MSTPEERKRRGDYPTPSALVDLVVEHTLASVPAGARVRVLDPACGDARFLVAVGRRLRAVGAVAELMGVELDAPTATAARAALAAAGFADARVDVGDALTRTWSETFDVVVGNPPYLSQLAAATTRGRASSHGGGPYADACAEFLALAIRLARPDGGRVGLVLPQSILSSRDAGGVRHDVDQLARSIWSWWSPARHFDAQVLVCALAFERRPARVGAPERTWSHVVTEALGVPALPPLAVNGVLGDHARLTANFRDQYYGLVPAVEDGVVGPPLITSGLIEPGACWWGDRAVTFARRRMQRPAVVLDRLSPPMSRWAEGMLVPKVLVANQTRVIEAVADPAGRFLPGVPVITLRPGAVDEVEPIAAVLTSPVATVWAWHQAAGTGLSADSLRLGPRWLAALPWPAGRLASAVEALRARDLAGCAAAVMTAYGVDPGETTGAGLLTWWTRRLPPTPPAR